MPANWRPSRGGHVSWPNDSPIATRLGLCSSLACFILGIYSTEIHLSRVSPHDMKLSRVHGHVTHIFFSSSPRNSPKEWVMLCYKSMFTKTCNQIIHIHPPPPPKFWNLHSFQTKMLFPILEIKILIAYLKIHTHFLAKSWKLPSFQIKKFYVSDWDLDCVTKKSVFGYHFLISLFLPGSMPLNMHCKISNISGTTSQNFSDCFLVLQLPLAKPLKPCVILIMKM